MNITIPAALSTSTDVQSLIERVRIDFDASDLVAVYASFAGGSLLSVRLYINSGVTFTFGCFDDALRFSEAAGFPLETIIEFRESFWYASFCKQSPKRYWDLKRFFGALA